MCYIELISVVDLGMLVGNNTTYCVRNAQRMCSRLKGSFSETGLGRCCMAFTRLDAAVGGAAAATRGRAAALAYCRLGLA
jgi:hypothetical protein